MKRAYVGIRSEPHYRCDAFVSGLRAIGLDVRIGPPQTFDAETVYCCWNRYGQNHDYCTRLESAGGVALIAENAYVAPGGQSPHDMNPRTWYALARGYHNDGGQVSSYTPERWNALGVVLQPFRATGEHVLVCPNRPFGAPGRAMPADWTQNVRQRLEKITKRPIIVRPHPGNSAPKRPLAEDLAGAHACVIWSSSAGVHALVAGVPVICEAPAWIARGAAHDGISTIESPYMSDQARLHAVHRLAWAQWSLAEIADGTAFRHLLQPARQAEVAAGA